jgi:hypothetical protein
MDSMGTWQMTWTDGAVVIGTSASDALRELADDPYNKIWQQMGQGDIKHQLASRVNTHNGATVDPELQDELFLIALAEAGTFTLTVSI